VIARGLTTTSLASYVFTTLASSFGFDKAKKEEEDSFFFFFGGNKFKKQRKKKKSVVTRRDLLCCVGARRLVTETTASHAESPRTRITQSFRLNKVQRKRKRTFLQFKRLWRIAQGSVLAPTAGLLLTDSPKQLLEHSPPSYLRMLMILSKRII
jgi:hypothetical protein